MAHDLILVLSGAVIGFLLGMIAFLLLNERPGTKRAWSPDSNRFSLPSLEDLGRVDRASRIDDTQAHKKLSAKLIQADTTRTQPIHLTTRSRAPVAMLIARGGALAGRTWLLRYASSTTIGRFDDCDIAVPDHGVSRLHAQITHRIDAATAHEFAIFDYSSTNGTMVNGQPINAVASLQDGDLIHIGNTSFTFRRVRQE